MYSHLVNQSSRLNDEQLSAARRFDELLTAADIQPTLNAGRIRTMAIIVSHAYRRALSDTRPSSRTDAWKTFIMAADRLAEVLPSQSFSGRELRRIVSENSDLLLEPTDKPEISSIGSQRWTARF
jgi:hypothetical protein